MRASSERACPLPTSVGTGATSAPRLAVRHAASPLARQARSSFLQMGSPLCSVLPKSFPNGVCPGRQGRGASAATGCARASIAPSSATSRDDRRSIPKSAWDAVPAKKHASSPRTARSLPARTFAPLWSGRFRRVSALHARPACAAERPGLRQRAPRLRFST